MKLVTYDNFVRIAMNYSCGSDLPRNSLWRSVYELNKYQDSIQAPQKFPQHPRFPINVSIDFEMDLRICTGKPEAPCTPDIPVGPWAPTASINESVLSI